MDRSKSTKPTMPPDALPIWVDSTICNQCVAFRHTFIVDSQPQYPELLIAADTDFIVWLNGDEIARGQFPDFPQVKDFSRIQLSEKLKSGSNSIAILAYHLGRDISTGINQTPFMASAIIDGTTVLTSTSTAWKANENTGWKNGYPYLRTGQLGFTTFFDSHTLSNSWINQDFNDSDWTHAVPAGLKNYRWRERPIPPCVLGNFIPAKLVKCGTFRRSKEWETPARTLVNDQYFFTPVMPHSAGSDDGIFAIFDLGKESCGFLCFDIQTSDGAVIDYAHGEHLDDGIVRAYVGERNFADRYLASDGRNHHELFFHRCGLRYIQINISNIQDKRAEIISTGIKPWDYPLPTSASLTTDDCQITPALRSVAKRTLELCMHEHFEDCCWREQSMYAYDSRNQALYGYYLWGNYNFVRSSYQLLADTWQYGSKYHLMSLCAPSVFSLSIPVFSLTWIIAAWENFLYSGDNSLFQNNAVMVKDILDYALNKQNPDTLLCHPGTESFRWNFYEWSPGLEGEFFKECPENQYHAAYNLYLIEALSCAAKLFDRQQSETYIKAADLLKKAVHKAFWDKNKHAYASKFDTKGFFPDYHEHIQFLAFKNHILPDHETEEMVFRTLKEKSLHYATLSSLPYLVDSMMPYSPESRQYAAEYIRNTYSAMLEKGATTFWETQKGAVDFANAGSLCHAWSSLPIYYQGAELLGIRPLEPGFSKFVVRPYADKWTHCADGEVPTPHGIIKVSWNLRENGIYLRVHAPEGTDFVCESYPECPVVSAETF